MINFSKRQSFFLVFLALSKSLKPLNTSFLLRSVLIGLFLVKRLFWILILYLSYSFWSYFIFYSDFLRLYYAFHCKGFTINITRQRHLEQSIIPDTLSWAMWWKGTEEKRGWGRLNAEWRRKIRARIMGGLKLKKKKKAGSQSCFC